ncbi:MAG: hypothetical protein COC19_03635 [SAR86 cluster bacterium]|uniref:Uncharacterized protein n=1 Tax=SAR86 cluster bacterium TaxID=2030880 RepID=A0A2A4MQC7_9GAMM|nr:MAG: hypothetical protein COC19_03635 [SAR86 cluster bacterium]
MTKKTNTSNEKRNAIVFLVIGLMFITLGVGTGGSWLFILSGALFITSALSSWYSANKSVKKNNNDS